VRWGESFEAAAGREFKKQTGLTAKYTVKGFFRKTDYTIDPTELLEDKLFVVIEASNVHGTLANAWPNGFNAWLTLDELRLEEKIFGSTYTLIEMIERGTYYQAQEAHYLPSEY